MNRPALLLLVLVVVTAAAWLFVPGRESAPPRSAGSVPMPATIGPVVAPRDVDTPPQQPIADAKAAPNSREVAAVTAVRGRLLQGDAALADIELRMVTGQPDRELATTRTAADGTFVLPTLDGRFQLTADAPAIPHGWRSQWMSCSSQDTALGDVHVPRCAVVRGVVRDQQGRVVAKARVAGPFSTTESDEHGQYRIDRVLPGGIGVQVSATGFAATSASTPVDEGAAVSLDVVLPAGLRVEGLVLDWRSCVLAGARVRCAFDGREVTTDAAGRFVMEHHPAGEKLTIEAPGHVPFESSWILDGGEVARVQLARAVTLRGVVHGAENVATTLRIEAASDSAPDAAPPGPYSLMYQPLPVAADGSFAIVGLSMSDYEVSARTAAGGVCEPVRVLLRDDASIELTIANSFELEVHVRGEGNVDVVGAELIANELVNEYPSLFQPDANDALGAILSGGAKPPLPAVAGKATLHVGNNDAVAFVARAPGFLPMAKFFAAGQVPPQTEVVLQRAGSVRGVVHGGHGAAYHRWVSFWPRSAGEAPPDKYKDGMSMWNSGNQLFHSIDIDAEGRFFAATVAPGSYRATVTRFGNARVGHRPDEQVGAIPMVDDDEDPRGVVDLEVTAGNETQLELTEPELGTLRGTVRLRGVPCAGVTVVAARPGPKARRFRFAEQDPDDWDNDLVRDFAPGQCTAADGTFTFLYRDAGPLELRVRHQNGAATSAPFVVTLPAPGDDVVRDLDVPLGAIRGRVPIEGLDAADEQSLEVVLFPMRKVADDPFCFGDYASALVWGCSKVVRPEHGRFAFDYLPDGDWLVRICCHAWPPTLFSQLFVHVQGGVVDLGDLTLPKRVTARLRWNWSTPQQPPVTVTGAWLRQTFGANGELAWAGTFGVKDGELRCGPIPPGRYVVMPFGFRGDGVWIHIAVGSSGKPQPIEIHADGSITPEVVTFVAEPPPK